MKKALLIALAILMVAVPVFAQAAQETTSAGPDKLSYWAPMNSAITANDFSELPYWQEVMARTNTDISFEHVDASSDSTLSEGFNILIASGDYPDIIEYKWAGYAGGPNAAIEDGIIIPLNDVFEKYCPNITKYLNEHPDIAKEISTDDGTYYCFPMLRGSSYENNNLLFSEGWVWRLDILNKAGITEVPETPEELYAALVAVKDLVEIPVAIRPDHISRVFAPGFDAWDDFYVEDGQVHYGYIEENRYEYLQFVHKLYAEGLLDNDYLALNKKSLGVKVLNNQCCGAYAPGGSGIGTWLPQMQAENPEVQLVSAKPLSPVKGRNSKFAKMSTVYPTTVSASAAITTSCKNIEAAARLLDYAYGEEGNLLANFGIEGVTYTMVDGYPTYTDLVKNNPEGLSMSQVMAKYMRCSTNGAIIQDPRYLEQYYELPELQQAINLWAQTDYGKYILPPVTVSADDAAESAAILNQVKTYASEMETKFITGAAELTEASFAEFVAQIKAFGIERAIEIEQKAYEAYMAK